MQAQIKKKDTWPDGVDTLISLRNQLMQDIYMRDLALFNLELSLADLG
jgi:hypothetical protein